jgi:hypothetical protein
MWRQELLCCHICWQYFVAKIFKNVSLCTYSKIDILMHKGFTNFIIAKNVKFKKLSLSPHLNCLSPHVANGDKVGHRWSKGVYKQPKELLLFLLFTVLLLFCKQVYQSRKKYFVQGFSNPDSFFSY